MLVLAICALAGYVHLVRPYDASEGLGYALGVAGGVAMLILLLYPIRKRMRPDSILGPVRHWFRLHMICGLLGPTLIIFHSSLDLRSINEMVAFTCMLLVAGSGIVGRYLYGKIHRGLYGSRARLEELRTSLGTSLEQLEPRLRRLPSVIAAIEEFRALADSPRSGRFQRATHFLVLGWHRRKVVDNLRVATAIAVREPVTDQTRPTPSASELESLMRSVEGTFDAIQRIAQFATYERLFSLWHVAHVPFVYLFVLSAIVHVLAVHMY